MKTRQEHCSFSLLIVVVVVVVVVPLVDHLTILLLSCSSSSLRFSLSILQVLLLNLIEEN